MPNVLLSENNQYADSLNLWSNLHTVPNVRDVIFLSSTSRHYEVINVVHRIVVLDTEDDDNAVQDVTVYVRRI